MNRFLYDSDLCHERPVSLLKRHSDTSTPATLLKRDFKRSTQVIMDLLMKS